MFYELFMNFKESAYLLIFEFKSLMF